MTNVEIRKERTSMELLEKVFDDKNLFKAELEQAREEIAKLQQELKDAQKTNE